MASVVKPKGLTARDVITVDDLTGGEIDRVLKRAASIKAGRDGSRLDDRTLALLFEQPSTRTRASFEAGMTRLGGHAMFLGPDQTQLSRGEPIRDVARALSQYVDAVALRVADHDDLVEFASYADVPTINALSDIAHPCQALADLLTVRECIGPLDEARVAWVGDGNNVCASFAVGCAAVDLDLTIATPPDYGLDDAVFDRIDAIGSRPRTTSDPTEVIEDTDAVYTDVWVSMSEESEAVRQEKHGAFEGFRLDQEMLAGSTAKVMHCLPAHRGDEITDDVLEGDRSIVWTQAANRMYVQCALLVELLGRDPSNLAQLSFDSLR